MAALTACSDAAGAELDAIAAIYGDAAQRTSTGTVRVSVGGGVSVSIALPPGYPETAAPVATLAADAPRATLRDAERRLAAVAASSDGERVLEIVQEAEPCVAAARAARAPAPPPAAAPDAYAVVHIDHMNDGRRYAETLRRWAADRVRGALFWQAAGTARREHVVLVLRGRDDRIGAFLVRLRAECVDVDRRGLPCKERRATVARRSAATAADAALDGAAWRAAPSVSGVLFRHEWPCARRPDKGTPGASARGTRSSRAARRATRPLN